MERIPCCHNSIRFKSQWFFLLLLPYFSLFAKGEPLLPEEEIEMQEALLRHVSKHHPSRMTGEWGGGRTLLENNGVFITSSYTTDIMGNPIGGRNQGFSYAGSWGLSVGVDFEQLCKAKGFALYGSMVWRTGTSLSRDHIGNQFPVQQLFGSQTVKLNELFLKQRILDVITIRAGRLDAGNDFLQSNLYYFFVSNAFCGNPISIFFNTTFTAYPSSTWGTYLSFQIAPWLLAKFAAYNANSQIGKNKYHGTNFTFESTNGVLWITEWDFLFNQGKKDTGYPGNYKFGFFFQSGRAPIFGDGVIHGDPCIYVLFDQMIYRPAGAKDSSRGLIPFFSLVLQPDNRNLIPLFIEGGFIYKGPVASRPKDAIACGVAYGRYSHLLARQERLLGGPFGHHGQTAETVLELNYWVQVNDWCTVTPDLQYIINPRGLGTIKNSLVIGAQIGVVL